MENKNNRPDIKSFLKPKSIAVIGASADLSTVGGKCVRFFNDHLYRGKIYPVNPKYGEVAGLKCYKSLLDISYRVDMAIIIVSVKYLFGVLDECMGKNVKSVVIFSAGFAETGDEEGKERERKLKKFTEKSGIRILGPNCYGFINFIDKVTASSSAVLERKDLIVGNIGLVSQSGGVGLSVIPFIAQSRGQGFSYVVNTGNEVDLDACDFLRFMVEDRYTKVIGAVIEEFRNGKKFIEEVAEFALEKNKPLVVLKIGRSEEGKRAAASHTGAMTGADITWDAVFKQKGIIRVDDINDLIEVTSAFSKCSVPKGDGIGMISPSGGVLALGADIGGALGLNFPELSRKTEEKISGFLKGFGNFRNPIDLSALAVNVPQIYETALDAMLSDENIGLVIFVMTIAFSYDELCSKIVDISMKTKKPILVAWVGGSFSGEGLKLFERNQVVVFNSIEKCMKVAKALIEYGKSVERFHEQKIFLRREPKILINVQNIRDWVSSKSGTMTERESKTLLSNYGIPTTREEITISRQDAIRAAKGIGYPVCLKVESPQIIHKSDADAIRLNIRTDHEVETCFEEVLNNTKTYNPTATINGVLIQEMAKPGVEIIIGMSKDHSIGKPIIMFGLGGIFVEILRDFSIAAAPITRIEALRMIEETKGYSVLKGTRNKPKADLNAIVDVLLKVSRISMELGDIISEIDINPLVVHEEGKGCQVLDASIII